MFFSVTFAESSCENISRWHAEMTDVNTQKTNYYAPEDFFTSDGAMIKGYEGQSNLIPGYFFSDTTCYTDNFEIEYIIHHVTGWDHVIAVMSITTEPYFDFDNLRSAPQSKKIRLVADRNGSDSLRSNYTVIKLGFRYRNDTLDFIRNGFVYERRAIPICKITEMGVYWEYGGGGVESIRLTDYANDTEYFEDFSDCENIQLFKECEPDPVVELSASYQLPSCKDSSLHLFANSNVLEDFHWIGPDSTFLSDEQNPVIADGWSAASGTYVVWGRLHRCVLPVYYKMDVAVPKKETVRDTVSSSLCKGDTLWLSSGPAFESGVYVDSLLTEGGCDSIVIHRLSILAPVYETVRLKACAPDDILFHGKYYTESGVYADTLKGEMGCDSLISLLYVTVNESFFSERFDTLCYGRELDGHTESGVYVDSLLTVNGCDSVSVLHINVLPKVEIDNGAVHICEGDSLSMNGHVYFDAGLYIDTLRTEGECDTFLITRLIIDSTFALENPKDVKVCRSAYLQLQIDSVAGASYRWSPTNYLSNSMVREPFVTAVENMKYDVFVERGVCRDSVSLSLFVSEGPRILDAVYDSDAQSVVVYAEGGEPAYLYSFQTSDWQSESHFDTEISVGMKMVKVKDDYGCEDEYSFLLLIPVFPEDHLSPNGDGIKDRWEIRNLEYYRHFVVKIFDRFGKQLVVYRDYYPGWDGYYQGHPMPSTDYWYVISIDELDYEKSGHFTLLRR